MERLHHHLRPWSKFCPGEGHQPGTETARRPGARELLDVHSEIVADDLGEMLERGVELRHHLGGRAFLRSVDRARTSRTGERIRHVAGDLDPGLLPVGVHASDVDPRQPRQGQPARR